MLDLLGKSVVKTSVFLYKVNVIIQLFCFVCIDTHFMGSVSTEVLKKNLLRYCLWVMFHGVVKETMAKEIKFTAGLFHVQSNLQEQIQFDAVEILLDINLWFCFNDRVFVRVVVYFSL